MKKENPQSAKWQQEQEQNNENSWFNEYQEVEDYIIKRIGDKFLEATPEKYNTASKATIALLENNWQQERMYSDLSELRNDLYDKLPISNVDAFEILKVINNHLKKLDALCGNK